MSYTSNYMFDNISRIGNDSSDLSQRTFQNVNSANYMLTNYYTADCNMSTGIEAALSQPNINFKGYHQTGLNGCNIDINSRLMIDKHLNNPKCRTALYQRPFATIPYLGKGSTNIEVESTLLNGDRQINRKTHINSSEKSHMAYSNTPLIPSVAATVTNPVNLVEGIAVDGWVKGGIPTRDIAKNTQ